MSIKVMSQVWNDNSLNPTQKLIVLALADNANDEGVCYPKLETIMQKTSLKRTAVVNNLKKLEEQKVLQKTYRSKQKRGGRNSNIYLLYPAENYANLDATFLPFFTAPEPIQSSPDGTQTDPIQSSPDGTQTPIQSSPDGTVHTITEPSLKIEPSLKSVSAAQKVAEHLREKILEFKPNFVVKNFNSWVKEIDKAIRIDNRTPEQLIAAIDWVHGTHRGNWWVDKILSGKKLREKYDTLEMQQMQGGQTNRQLQDNLDMAQRILDEEAS